MKKLMIVLGIFFSCVGGLLYAHAQSTNIPNVIADGGVSDAKNLMDKDIAILASDNSQMQAAETELQTRQQMIIALASQVPPLNSAVALCTSNPTAYCPGWTPPTCVTTGGSCTTNSECCSNNCYGTSGVNWTAGTCQ